MGSRALDAASAERRKNADCIVRSGCLLDVSEFEEQGVPKDVKKIKIVKKHFEG